jgi:hypothetical protein
MRSDHESRVLDESAKYSLATYWSSGRDTENDICAMSRRAPELNRLPKV